MATTRPELDSPPPLPPGLQPPQQGSISGLAGPQQQPSGSASLQEAVLKKMMFVEQSLQDIGEMMPSAQPSIDGFVNQLRSGLGKILMKGAQAPSAAGPGSLLQGVAPVPQPGQ